MKQDEAVEKAMDLLPEKLLRLHVAKEAIPYIWGCLGSFIFAEANGLYADDIAKELFPR